MNNIITFKLEYSDGGQMFRAVSNDDRFLICFATSLTAGANSAMGDTAKLMISAIGGDSTNGKKTEFRKEYYIQNNWMVLSESLKIFKIHILTILYQLGYKDVDVLLDIQL